MQILKDIELKPYTSMYVGGPAKFFVEVKSEEELVEALLFKKKHALHHFILGGGSNILVSDKGFDGLVLKINILGKKLISETNKNIIYEVFAGENWDDFVKFSVNQGLYGIENLSHIPGTVGASVVQNIGSYGQEVAPIVVSVKVLNVETLQTEILLNKDLEFSYRKSVLNSKNKGKYIVTSVIFCLEKQGVLNMKYDDIKKYFEKNFEIEPDLKTIRAAVINIRNSKFPFPDSPKNGSVGSFWNAEVVSEKTYESMVKKLKLMGFEKKALEMENKKSVFTVSQGYKVPYGILIETLGFRGKAAGGAKILETHTGVINNYTGRASSEDICRLSEEVINSVDKEFGVKLKTEPEFVGDFD